MSEIDRLMNGIDGTPVDIDKKRREELRTFANGLSERICKVGDSDNLREVEDFSKGDHIRRSFYLKKQTLLDLEDIHRKFVSQGKTKDRFNKFIENLFDEFIKGYKIDKEEKLNRVNGVRILKEE